MFTNPSQTVNHFEILSGMRVADFGAGAGFFVLAAAPLLGENGRIYAVDIQKELLSKIKRDAENRGFFNVELIWGDAEKIGGTKLADNSLDVVIASNILFQVNSKESLIEEVKRVLKPGKGKVFVIEWRDSFGGLGPEPSFIVSPENSKALFLASGFEFYKSFPTGPHHYGLAFRKK